MKQTSRSLRLNVGIAWKNGEFSVSRLIGVPQDSDFFLRSTTQMSIWPTLPGLPDEKNSCLSLWLMAGPNSGPMCSPLGPR